MFGNQAKNNGTDSARPAAAEVARIQGGGLAQIIVTELHPLTYYLFLNDTFVPQEQIAELSVSIEAPSDTNPDGMVRATLNRVVPNVAGESGRQSQELFPCNLVIVALGRRIALSAPNAGSLDGLWISLGMRADGSGAEVTGAQSMRIVLTESILDAKLTWTDGETEDLLPQS